MHPPKTIPLYRLTLTVEAFGLAVAKSKPLAGKAAFLRKDGKWDVMVTLAAVDQLKQMATEKENLSDTVVRLLSGGLPQLPNPEGV